MLKPCVDPTFPNISRNFGLCRRDACIDVSVMIRSWSEMIKEIH